MNADTETVSIGEKIRLILGVKRWSQKEFAKEIGVSPAMIPWWINGRFVPNEEKMPLLEQFYQEAYESEMPPIHEMVQRLYHKYEEDWGHLANILGAHNGDVVRNWAIGKTRPRPHYLKQIDAVYLYTFGKPKKKKDPLPIAPPRKREKIVIPWTTRR